MARFINDDYKLKHGGRKAPKMSIEELQDKLEDFELVEVLAGTPETVGLEKDVKFFGMAMDEVFDDSESFDAEAVGESLVGYHTLDNGFTFLGLAAFGELGYIAPMFTILYFDGKKIRAYTPTCGNAVNTETKCFIGHASYDDELDIDFEKLTQKYVKEGLLPKGSDTIDDVNILEALYLQRYEILPKGIDFSKAGELENSWFADAYLESDGEIRNDLVLFNWDAIKEDILARIEVF